MMKSKRGMALSMETIVIAIIVVVVLVVMLLIFVSNMNKNNTKLQSCSAQSGQCSSTPCADNGKAELQKTAAGKGNLQSCAPAETYCCASV